jgi:hypothetical protein
LRSAAPEQGEAKQLIITKSHFAVQVSFGVIRLFDEKMASSGAMVLALMAMEGLKSMVATAGAAFGV